MAELDVARIEDFPPGSVKIVVADSIEIGVYNCGGELLAIEDRCSHDDGPLAEGDWDPEERVVICPRHGSKFDLTSGRPLSLPAFEPVRIFPVHVEDGMVKVEVA